jgi:hypothetical protein
LKSLRRLGRELREFEASAAAAKVEKRPPVQPEKKFSITYDLLVEVRVVDGKTVTNFRTDAAHWIKANAWCLAKSFQRIIRFYDRQIPPEYAYALEHQGLRYGPTEVVYINALDGERLYYWRRHDKETTGRVGDEEKGSEL